MSVSALLFRVKRRLARLSPVELSAVVVVHFGSIQRKGESPFQVRNDVLWLHCES